MQEGREGREIDSGVNNSYKVKQKHFKRGFKKVVCVTLMKN